MICPNCQAENQPSAKFCAKCGTRLEQPSQQPVQQAPRPWSPEEALAAPAAGAMPETAPELPEAPEKKSKKALFIILPAAVLLLAATAAVLLMYFGVIGGSKSDLTLTVALMDEDGNIYASQNGGAAVKIPCEAKEISVTPDGQRVIALDEDGVLYAFSPDGKNRFTVAEGVSTLGMAANDFVSFYTRQGDEATIQTILNQFLVDYNASRSSRVTMDEVKNAFWEDYPDQTVSNAQDFYYDYIGTYPDFAGRNRYYYAYGASAPVLVKSQTVRVSREGMHLLYAFGNAIYLRPEGAAEAERIADYDPDTMNLLMVSNDGTVAAWDKKVESGSGGDRISELYVYRNGEITKEATLSGSYTSLQSAAYDTLGMMYVAAESADLYWTRAGGEDKDLTLDAPLVLNSVRVSEALGGILLITENTSNSDWRDLTFLNWDGDASVLVRDIQSVVGLDENRLIYRDSDDKLYAGEIVDGKLENKRKIASGVGDVRVSQDCRYVYYFKDYSDGAGTLYFCDVTQEEPEPVRVDKNVNATRGRLLALSEDGKTVAYIKNYDYEETDAAVLAGDLYVSTMGGEPERVSKGVADIYSSDGVFPSGALYYFAGDDTEFVHGIVHTVGTLYVYNGKDSKELQDELLYSTER